MSDIGGLGQALFYIAANLIGWFSNMNAGLFLMRNLFVSTSPAFLAKRNTLTSSSLGLFKKQGEEDSSNSKPSIFDKFKR
jgi:hypothetical protein